VADKSTSSNIKSTAPVQNIPAENANKTKPENGAT
jgi:hypothetical protein